MKFANQLYRCLRPQSRTGLSNKINARLNNFEKRSKRTRLISHPVKLDIVPTKLCNLNCIFCIQYSSAGVTQLSLSNFKILARKLFPYADSVYFCSGGEPFLNRNFLEFLDICQNNQMLINITSNGTLLTEAISQKLIKNDHIATFNFSFDGAKKETVESIRRGVSFEKVVNNMRAMADLKRVNKSEFPLLNINFAAMRRNIEELPDLVQQAHKWGMDMVSVNYLNVANEIDPQESLFYHPELRDKIFKEVRKISDAENIHVNLPEQVGAQRNNRSCDCPWRFMKIDPDGSVKFCYKAWDNPIGNIFEGDDFNILWNSIHYQLLRKTINSDKPYFKYCRACSVRTGSFDESAHIKDLREDLYEFDKDFEKMFNLTVPARTSSHAGDERSVRA